MMMMMMNLVNGRFINSCGSVFHIFRPRLCLKCMLSTACSGKNIVQVFALTGEMRMDITIKLKIKKSSRQ